MKFKKIGKRVFITPVPFLHGITGKVLGSEGKSVKKGDPFDHLVGILNEGYKEGSDDDNSYPALPEKEGKQWWHSNPSKKEGITKDDHYAIRLFQEEGHPHLHLDPNDNELYYFPKGPHVIRKSKPENILAIDIAMPEKKSSQELERKMQFYKREISDKYSVPIRFYSGGKRILPKNIEQKLTSVIAIGGLVGSIFFLSSNITGNAIADFSTNTTSWVGGGLLIVGLVAGFFWIKSKKRKSLKKSMKK